MKSSNSTKQLEKKATQATLNGYKQAKRGTTSNTRQGTNAGAAAFQEPADIEMEKLGVKVSSRMMRSKERVFRQGQSSSKSRGRVVPIPPCSDHMALEAQDLSAKGHHFDVPDINLPLKQLQLTVPQPQSSELSTAATTLQASKKRPELSIEQQNERLRRSLFRMPLQNIPQDQQSRPQSKRASPKMTPEKTSSNTKKRKLAEITNALNLSNSVGKAESSGTKKRKLNSSAKKESEQNQVTQSFGFLLQEQEPVQEVHEPVAKEEAKINTSQAIRKPTFLSSETNSLLRTLLKAKKPTTTQEEGALKRSSKLGDTELTFKDITGKSEGSTPESTKSKHPVKIPPLSVNTQSLVDQLKKEMSSMTLNPSKRPEPLPPQVKKDQDILTAPLNIKYEELLSTPLNLVLPLHYKRLLDLSRSLDNSLNFIKQRHAHGTQGILFDDLKSSKIYISILSISFRSFSKQILHSDLHQTFLQIHYSSVEKTYGKQFDLRTFQQLLFVCPHFYTHTWVKKPRAYNQLTLLIDFGEGCHHLGQGQLDARQAEMRGRLLSVARGHYEMHMGQYLAEKASGLLAVTVRDPFESGRGGLYI